MPKVAILDPELTVGLPPKLTAATGMDALAHCLEAYCAPFYHPLSAGVALEGMRLVKENLAKAVKKRRDLDARGNMLMASAMGATAFQRGLGAIHALSHPFGGLYDAHHGLLNGIIMPYVLKANRRKIEKDIERAAAYLGIKGGFDGFLKWILALRKEIGIPHALQDIGIDAKRLDRGGGDGDQGSDRRRQSDPVHARSNIRRSRGNAWRATCDGGGSRRITSGVDRACRKHFGDGLRRLHRRHEVNARQPAHASEFLQQLDGNPLPFASRGSRAPSSRLRSASGIDTPNRFSRMKRACLAEARIPVPMMTVQPADDSGFGEPRDIASAQRRHRSRTEFGRTGRRLRSSCAGLRASSRAADRRDVSAQPMNRAGGAARSPGLREAWPRRACRG